jgi:hypothetical protein
MESTPLLSVSLRDYLGTTRPGLLGSNASQVKMPRNRVGPEALFMAEVYYFRFDNLDVEDEQLPDR